MKNLIFYISLAFFCLSSTLVFSQTTFTGASTLVWNDPASWSNGIPSSGNDATIPPGVTVFIDFPLVANFGIDIQGTVYNLGQLDLVGNMFLYSTGQLFNENIITNNGNLLNHPPG